MVRTRMLAVAGILTGITVLLQIIPAIFSEIFVVCTIFSAIPVYIIAYRSPRLGICSVIAAYLLITVISPHEGMFFLFTNGPVGMFLGIGAHYKMHPLLMAVLAGAVLTCTLSVLNYVIGIPVLWTPLTGKLLTQVGLLFAIAEVYCLFYVFGVRAIGSLIEKSLTSEVHEDGEKSPVN